jgi:hypothetical protein
MYLQMRTRDIPTGDVIQDNNTFEAGGTVKNMQVIWTTDGTNTTFKVYRNWDRSTVIYEHTQLGTVNYTGQYDQFKTTMFNGDAGCTIQDHAVYEFAATASQMDVVKDALAQNQAGYVDPNPNCIPP